MLRIKIGKDKLINNDRDDRDVHEYERSQIKKSIQSKVFRLILGLYQKKYKYIH